MHFFSVLLVIPWFREATPRWSVDVPFGNAHWRNQEIHDFLNQKGNISRNPCLGHSYFWHLLTLQMGLVVNFNRKIDVSFAGLRVSINRFIDLTGIQKKRHLGWKKNRQRWFAKRLFLLILLGKKSFTPILIRPKARYLWWFWWNFWSCWNFFGYQVHLQQVWKTTTGGFQNCARKNT